MNSTYVLTLIQAFILNFPVLSDWGYAMGKPIMLVSSSFKNCYTMLTQLTPVYKDITLLMNKQTSKEISFTDSVPIIAALPSPRKYNKLPFQSEIISLIYKYQSACITQAGNSVFIIISENIVPSELKDLVFEVHIDEGLPLSSNPLSLVPDANSLPIIRELIKKRSDPQEELALIAAAHFVLPKLKEMGEEKLFPDILSTAKELVQESKMYAEIDSLSLLFCDLFDAFIDKYSTDVFRKLLNITKEDLDKDLLFYNDHYVFISTNRFESIIGPMNNYPITAIKSALVESNFLVREEQSSFLSKMAYRVDNQPLSYKKMLKFNITKFTSKFYKNFLEELEQGGN